MTLENPDPVPAPVVTPPPRLSRCARWAPELALGLHWMDALPRLYLPLLVLLCASVAWQRLGAGDDFWAHAAIGRWIWQHGAVPRHTLFIWSVPPTPWIAHSWLTQLSFYLLMALGGEQYGPYFTLLLTVCLAALPFCLIWRLWTRYTPATCLMPLIFTLAVWCATPRFHPRPELFTALFLTMLLTFLIRWHDPQGRREGSAQDLSLGLERGAWGIPAMFVLWTNYHGAVALGLVILGVTVGCDLLQNRCDARSRQLAWMGLLCSGAIFLNPWGAAYWSALRPVHSAMFAHIDEWKPYWQTPFLNTRYVWGEATLVGIALGGWVANRGRRWSHFGWLVVISAAFIISRRHLWILALVALAVMAANARALDTETGWKIWHWLRYSRRWPELQTAVVPKPLFWQRLARLGVTIYLVVWILYSTPRDILPLKAVLRGLPTRLASFVARRHLPGHMFNDYEVSSYLQWRFAGHPPLYIDLLNAYPEHLLVPDYFDIVGANEHGQKLLKKCGYVVLRHYGTSEGLAPLGRLLNGQTHGAQPRWARIYKQNDGTVWVRRTPAYARFWRHPGR